MIVSEENGYNEWIAVCNRKPKKNQKHIIRISCRDAYFCVSYTKGYEFHFWLRLQNIRNLLDFFILIDQIMRRIQPHKFHFLVLGLNPHAGEEGLLGLEEKQEIVLALKQAQRQGVNISGPFPPDIVFRNALNRPDKIVIALYHDQGLIPLHFRF